MKENIFTDEGKALVSKLRCEGDVLNISQAVAAIGGFERLVEPGDTILVKPNFNTAEQVCCKQPQRRGPRWWSSMRANG